MLLFFWPFRTKVSFLPSIYPHPTLPHPPWWLQDTKPTEASETQFAPRYASLSQAPTCLQKVSEERLGASRMFLPTSLLSVQKLFWKPGAGLLLGGLTEVFLDGNQCLFTNCQGTSGRNWRGVGRKKKLKHQKKKKGQNKNLSQLTTLQTGLPRISPVKHLLRSKCYLAMKWRSEAFRLSHPSIFTDLARKLWVSKNYQLLGSLFLFSRQHLSLWLRPVWILSINNPPASLMYGKAQAPPYRTELRDWSSWVTELTQYRLTSCLQARGTALTGSSKPLEGRGWLKTLTRASRMHSLEGACVWRTRRIRNLYCSSWERWNRSVCGLCSSQSSGGSCRSLSVSGERGEGSCFGFWGKLNTAVQYT